MQFSAKAVRELFTVVLRNLDEAGQGLASGDHLVARELLLVEALFDLHVEAPLGRQLTLVLCQLLLELPCPGLEAVPLVDHMLELLVEEVDLVSDGGEFGLKLL